MKNTRQKAATTIASDSDSLVDNGVCNISLVSRLIHEKPNSLLFFSLFLKMLGRQNVLFGGSRLEGKCPPPKARIDRLSLLVNYPYKSFIICP